MANLDRWLRERGRSFGNPAESLLRKMAAALRDYAAGDFQQAAAGFEDVLPDAGKIGGSGAQNTLFADLAAAARARSFAAAA